MKLHLPKGLRTALLAVVAIGSTVYSSSAAPAAYDYDVAKYEDVVYIKDSLPGIETSSSFASPNMKESWVTRFAPYSVWGAPCSDDDKYSGGCVIVGNRFIEYKSTQVKKGDVKLPSDMSETDFCIYFCPNGKIYSLSKSGRKQLLGEDPNGTASLTLGITPFQVTLNWVVNGDGTGSLYYTSGSAISLGPNDEVINGDTSNFTDKRITILENIEMTDANLAAIGNIFTTSEPLASLNHTTEIFTTTYKRGSEESPARWEITGKADLAQLIAGEYLDNTTTGEGVGTGRALVVRTEEAEGDSIYFMGDSGVVYTETDATLSNNTVAEVDVLNGGTSCSVGFGAAEGATLTVERTALDNSVLSETLNEVRIVGDGTVKLVTDGAAASNIHVKSIAANSTLHVQNSQGSSIYLTEGTVGANADIIHSGDNEDLKYINVFVRDDGKAGTSVALNSIDVQNGHLTVSGFIPAEDATSAPSYAGFKANELKASHSVYIEADAVLGSVSSELAQDYAGGTIQVGSISAETGGVSVAEAADVTAGSVAAGGAVSVSGSLKVAETLTAGDGMTVAQTGAVVANQIIVSGGEISVQGVLEADKVSAGGLRNDAVEIKSLATLSPLARTPEPVLLSGNVKVTGTSVQADSIAAGSSVDITSGEGVSFTAKTGVNDVTVTVDESEIITGATTTDAISITADSRTDANGEIVKSGSLETGSLTAKKLEVKDGLTVDAKKLTVEELTAGNTTYTAVKEMTNVTISETEVTADRIEAEEVEIGTGYTVNNAIIDAKTIVGSGVTLNSVKFEGAMVTNGNLALQDTEFRGNGSTFGGAVGIAYIVDPDEKGVGSVVMNGEIEGGNLDITKLVVNGEELSFESNEVPYTIVARQEDNTLSFKGKQTVDEISEADLTLYIKPYIIASAKVESGMLTLTGRDAEKEIKSSLSATDNTAAVIKAIDSPAQKLKPGSVLSELNDYIGHVHRYSQEQRQEVVEALSGASLTALADSQRRGVLDVQDNLRNRIIQMGGGTNAGLTTDWQYAGIQAWAQADGAFSSSDGSGDECGYDYDTWGATVGANLDLTANTVVGMSFSASYGEIKSDGADHASGNNDAQYISFFVRHQKERWVQMLILTAGMNDMDMERSVLGYKANGETEGTTLSAYYELGYTFGLNYEFTHILQPIVSVSMTSAKVDGYTEDGSIGNAGLTYDGDSYFYGTVGIGARYQGVLYETVHERNAVVEARALITQDFGDATETAKVALGNSDMYEVTGTDSSGTGFELGAGVSIPVEQHTTFYADVDMTIRPDTTGFRGNIGVRYDF